MFEAKDKAEEGRHGSLLTLARALQEERERTEAEDAAARPAAEETPAEAAAQHRLARARREAKVSPSSGPLMDALARARDPEELPSDAAGESGDASDAPDLDAISQEPPGPPPAEPARPPYPSFPDMRPQAEPPEAIAGSAIPEDDRWRPLIDPHMVLGRIARSKTLIASTTLAGALLGVAIALSTPKKYQAIAEVLVDPRDLKIVEREITAPGLPSEATLAIIENQGRILTSGPVLAKVVEKLNLTSDPEFNGQGGSRLTGLLNPISLVRSLLARSDAPDNARLESRATASLAEKVTVERTGKTFILNVEVSTDDAEKSALVANTLVDTYLDAAGRLQSETAGRATSELTARLEELRRSVEEAEDKVEQFKSENDIIDPQGRSIADEELIKLNDQLSIARARTLELNARADSARQLDIGSVLSGGLPEGMNSSVLTELRSQYASVKQSVDNAAVSLGPRHPQRQALEAQLSGARDQISAELRRIVSSIQVELKRAVELEQDLAARLAQLKVRRGNTGQDLVRLRELERDANSKRAVYESFLLRARETGEQKDLNTANVSVISRADPPLEPSGPSRAMIAGGGTMAGLLAGLGIAGLLGALDSLRGSSSRRDARTRRVPPPSSRPMPANPSAPAAATHSTVSREADMSTSSAPRAAYYPQTSQGQWGPGAQPDHAPPPYPYGQHMAQPHVPSAAPSQPYWQQPSPPLGWHSPGHASQGWQPSQQGYAPAYPPPPYPYGQQVPVAEAPPAPDAVIRSLSESIDEIRTIVRECRDAMRALADRHARRFF